jgi:transcriptional antiterminator NusG
MENLEQPKWYALHTKSGSEPRVLRDMNTKLDKYPEFKDYIVDIKMLEEDEIVEKDGKRKVVKRRKLPNYVFIKMTYTDRVWEFVTSTEGVTCFCGPKGRPISLLDDEVRRMGLEVLTIDDIDIKEGDEVRVINGALENFFGVVEGINAERQKVKVVVSMFGRQTPVELDFTQIEKLV